MEYAEIKQEGARGLRHRLGLQSKKLLLLIFLKYDQVGIP